ncbi:MAG: hypothetical protein GX458_22090 [Phyllobacteriaceae bacterium]|nr:hypothetical protein [Phyllobacteriaceae bacterium]
MTALASAHAHPVAAPIFAARAASEDVAALLLVLAGLFAASPTQDTVAALRRGAGADLLTRLAGDAALAEPIAAFRAGLAGETDDATLARRLGRVFGLLFLGLSGPATVAPYESVHRCGGRLFQAPTGEMDRLLAAHDLSVGFDREPSDHLAIETALLAHLMAAGHPDRFALADRLRGWLPAFRAGLDATDDTGFHAASAALLAAAIEAGQPHDDSRTA